MNIISANSVLFTHTELRLSTIVRKCKVIKYTLTEHEVLTFGSKHPTVLFTDHNSIEKNFAQRSNKIIEHTDFN